MAERVPVPGLPRLGRQPTHGARFAALEVRCNAHAASGMLPGARFWSWRARSWRAHRLGALRGRSPSMFAAVPVRDVTK